MGCLRSNGRVSLMGGVGLVDGVKLALLCRWNVQNDVIAGGQWLCPRSAEPRFISMV